MDCNSALEIHYHFPTAHWLTMTAKEPMSKLTPNERLARKRAAARLRQQRCRARKRQALQEEKRLQSGTTVPQDSKTHTCSAFRHTQLPMTREASVSPSLPHQQPIYKVVSFESQRSFEESTRGEERSPNICKAAPSKEMVISIPEESPSDSPGSEEEAAAIAAMLSLKASPTGSRQAHDLECHVVHHQPRPTTIPYYRSWEAQRYGKPRYGLQPRVPRFHGRMPHPPRPHPHFRYYPTSFPRYVRYD
eukprot:scaffold880_cov132-Cylindrotheca_fusiformis.AAC.68